MRNSDHGAVAFLYGLEGQKRKIRGEMELLILAGKAAGVVPASFGRIDVGWYDSMLGLTGAWDPLGDDGDAFRLLSRLRLDLEQNTTSESEESWVCVSGYGHSVMQEFRSEPSRIVATRRAIVLVAAQIGWALEEDGR